MRRVGIYGGLMAGTLVAGLVLRFAPLGLPWVVMKYGGSVMWALMVYWVCAVVLPRWRAPGVFMVADVAATAMEFLKLYRVPWLDAFRLTLPGILLLGRQFSWWDVLAYWVAIGGGAWVDWRWMRRVGSRSVREEVG